jgi:hypothetical protein
LAKTTIALLERAGRPLPRFLLAEDDFAELLGR